MRSLASCEWNNLAVHSYFSVTPFSLSSSVSHPRYQWTNEQIPLPIIGAQNGSVSSSPPSSTFCEGVNWYVRVTTRSLQRPSKPGGVIGGTLAELATRALAPPVRRGSEWRDDGPAMVIGSLLNRLSADRPLMTVRLKDPRCSETARSSLRRDRYPFFRLPFLIGAHFSCFFFFSQK